MISPNDISEQSFRVAVMFKGRRNLPPPRILGLFETPKARARYLIRKEIRHLRDLRCQILAVANVNQS